MDTVIRRWGNSPAVRLNAAAMNRAAFTLDQPVTVTASRGRIVIEPAEATAQSLDDLVAAISDENRHDEADFGKPIGRESF